MPVQPLAEEATQDRVFEVVRRTLIGDILLEPGHRLSVWSDGAILASAVVDTSEAALNAAALAGELVVIQGAPVTNESGLRLVPRG